MVELRRYVDRLEAERHKERTKSEAILEVGTNIDAGHRGTPTRVEESLVEKETLPKAKRTRGLSSDYQSNFFRSDHKFSNKS